VASQPAGRDIRRATAGDTDSEDRRGWLSHGLAALGISALGLAIAGSISLTTSAQPLPVKEPATTSTVTSPTTRAAEPKKAVESDLDKTDAAALSTFAPRGDLPADETGSVALRTAVLKEQAAQRAEELAKGADDITRAASTAVSDARQSKLSAA
jgi:hypothetical protein